MASCAAGSDLTSVTDFVRSVKEAVTAINSGDAKPSTVPHIVIGNEAGDADSILSVIGLSYVKSLQSTAENTQDDKLFVPVVSIPAESLKFQRPETTYLLSDCAGMENVKADVNDVIAKQHFWLSRAAPSKRGQGRAGACAGGPGRRKHRQHNGRLGMKSLSRKCARGGKRRGDRQGCSKE